MKTLKLPGPRVLLAGLAMLAASALPVQAQTKWNLPAPIRRTIPIPKT